MQIRKDQERNIMFALCYLANITVIARLSACYVTRWLGGGQDRLKRPWLLSREKGLRAAGKRQWQGWEGTGMRFRGGKEGPRKEWQGSGDRGGSLEQLHNSSNTSKLTRVLPGNSTSRRFLTLMPWTRNTLACRNCENWGIIGELRCDPRTISNLFVGECLTVVIL